MASFLLRATGIIEPLGESGFRGLVAPETARIGLDHLLAVVERVGVDRQRFVAESLSDQLRRIANPVGEPVAELLHLLGRDQFLSRVPAGRGEQGVLFLRGSAPAPGYGRPSAAGRRPPVDSGRRDGPRKSWKAATNFERSITGPPIGKP